MIYLIVVLVTEQFLIICNGRCGCEWIIWLKNRLIYLPQVLQFCGLLLVRSSSLGHHIFHTLLVRNLQRKLPSTLNISSHHKHLPLRVTRIYLFTYITYYWVNRFQESCASFTADFKSNICKIQNHFFVLCSNGCKGINKRLNKRLQEY